jgi:NAD+ diphosphatase
VSILAGFVEVGESLEQAVHREVAEEVDVSLSAVRYHGSQPWPFPRSLMLGFAARASSTAINVDGEEIETAAWFTREEVRTQVAAGDLSLPGPSSIAHRLIQTWLEGELEI